MSIRTIVTRGFGNGIFGSRFLATRGYAPGLIGLSTSYKFTGQNVVIEESQPSVFLNFNYHRVTERKIIVTTPQNFENISLSAGTIHTYIFDMFNNPTDKFCIIVGLDFQGQDISVTTWFSNTPAGRVIEHSIPLTRHAPNNIQLTQSSTNIFLECDQFGSVINLPPGIIFFNFRNRENRDTSYTMLVNESSCVES